MNIEDYRNYCLSLPLAEESTPFDETTLVYKIGGRMFSYAGMDNFERLAVKCDPDNAVELRERYVEVTPAFHSSKRHWNDIWVTGSLSDEFIGEQIRASYMLVLQNNVTPKSLRDEIMATLKELKFI